MCDLTPQDQPGMSHLAVCYQGRSFQILAHILPRMFNNYLAKAPRVQHGPNRLYNVFAVVLHLVQNSAQRLLGAMLGLYWDDVKDNVYGLNTHGTNGHPGVSTGTHVYTAEGSCFTVCAILEVAAFPCRALSHAPDFEEVEVRLP